MRPVTQIVQMTYQNPHASMPLYVPIAVVCNTSDEDLERNITLNASLELEWVSLQKAHDTEAVLVGGGPSLKDYLDIIRDKKAHGAVIFAMNAAHQYLISNGISPDYQVIADAKEETAQLVDLSAKEYLIASQVNKSTTDKVLTAKGKCVLWHLEIGNVEKSFPEERVKRGGYTLIGGGAAVGNSSLCLAYAMGYRSFHCFGYDSSHKDGSSHVYQQPMNQFIPTVEVEWAGKKYTSSVSMKAQAEKFQITAQALKQAGCDVTVYGEGLLPAMYNTLPGDMTERDKYRLMWSYDRYREVAPGEMLTDLFIDVAKPDGLVVDFGCGTGRAALSLHRKGYQVFLLDFADNSRDEEALGLPFLEWDLENPCPIRSPYGFCTDVMEHIRPEAVDNVLYNIGESAKKVFFQISTIDDCCGAMIGHPLHLSVHPFAWWEDKLKEYFDILWSQDMGETALFYVTIQQ